VAKTTKHVATFKNGDFVTEDQPPPPLNALRTFAIGAQRFPAETPATGLYIISTPIGNLDDITLRALKILAGATALYCEDTRQTRRLLDRYGISRRPATYHEHNARTARRDILARLGEGASVALISDAGTPLISDPGFKLVRDVVQAGHGVFPVPGASALLAAVVACGLPTDQLHFHGFLPPKPGARKRAIAALADIAASLVFYESPRRTAAALADLAKCLGDRPAAVARELTKLHEEIARGTLLELAGKFEATPPRGEVVLVVAGADPDLLRATDEDIDQMLRAAMKDATLRDAVASVAAQTGRKKTEIYARALKLSEAER